MSLPLNEHLVLSPYFVDTSATPGFNWERFQDGIDAIPESLFGLMVDEVTSEFIKSLIQKYTSLSVQGPDTARLIRDVIMGDIFIGDMPAEISRKLGVDQATAREVANEVVSRLFAPVLEDIKKVQAARFPNRIAQQPKEPQRTAPHPVQQSYPGEELPESGGNIIDLRNK